jgi:ubiquinone/menaquinone biosynthesis C-methylase UbiE
VANVYHKKIVQEYYSKRARDYDQQKIRTWKSERGFGADLIKEIVRALIGFEDKRVLEVGVGSGRIGFPLTKEVKPFLVGLDVSREMLELSREKMSLFNQKFDIVLGDAENMPFSDEFDAIVCISTMHYLADPGRSLTEFSQVLKEKGVLVYGDVTLHELDHRRFLDTLETVLSKAHAQYYKPSEMKKLIEDHGFNVLQVRVTSYRKSFLSLVEDKGKYFDVKLETLNECIAGANRNEKELYSISNSELTLLYALIIASR